MPLIPHARSIFAACLFGLAATISPALPTFARGSEGSAYADSCATRYHVECVTKWVSRVVPYDEIVTLYDSCGRPYQVHRTCYRTVRVQVKARVLVSDK